MLNFALKGTYQDETGYSWDYYRDDQLDPNPNPNTFYILPKPQFVFDNTGKPSFQVLSYQTDGPTNGAGFVRFDVELSVPAVIETAIANAIQANPTKFPGVTQASFITMALNPGTKVCFDLATDGVTQTFSASASSFGSNVASFLLNLSKNQLATFTELFTKSGGAIDITYYLSVPARLQGVAATLSFNSAIAYQYQVTQPTYDSWGDETNPETVTKKLQESASSTVQLTWGIAQPTPELVKSVTDWANNTIANQVSAEVASTIKLQGLNSDNSFNINEISNFTSDFKENIVVNWLIAPTATLPSLADLQLNIADFSGTVNEQKQQMTITTNLPFINDSTTSNVPLVPTSGGVAKPAFVKNVTVTVQYPTLSQANNTFTFSVNSSQTFMANYDATAGPVWGVEYTVNYADPDMPSVNGKIDKITTGNYFLKLEEAGILNICFDATQAFTSESTIPNEIDIDLSYVNDQDVAENGIHQKIKILKTDPGQKAIFSSLCPMPISATYNYQVTYVYTGETTYQAPLVSNQNGFTQFISAADVMHPVNVTIFVSAAEAADNPLLNADVNIWYDNPPLLPPGFSNSLPSEASPAVFNLSPNSDAQGNQFVSGVFTGLKSANQPLVYSAAINTGEGQILINAQKLQSTQSSILLNATQRYFTLEVDPAALVWTNPKFLGIKVIVTFTISQGTATKPLGVGTKNPQDLIWNNGENGSQYLTISIQDGNVIVYDLTVEYTVSGTDAKVIQKKALSDIVFNVPPLP